MSGDDRRPLATPDGRYLVVRGRLWRRTDPALPEERRDELVHELMDARRAKKAAFAAGDHDAVEAARSRVDAAKTALGERGPVWWSDDAPDETRRLARTTRYAEWFAEATAEADGGDPPAG
ncbi:biopolymer transporter Tol [Frigoribacterium salinisoli]